MNLEELSEALKPIDISSMEAYHKARIEALTNELNDQKEFLGVVRTTMKKMYVHMFNNQWKLQEVGVDWHNVQLIIEKLNTILEDE